MVGKALLLWLGLFALAFLNGALRETLLVRLVAVPWAQRLSALTAILFFTVLVRSKGHFLAALPRGQKALVSVVWVGLTALVETLVLNRWLGAMSWKEIGGTYDVTRGEAWPFVLVWIAVLPWVAARKTGRYARTLDAGPAE